MLFSSPWSTDREAANVDGGLSGHPPTNSARRPATNWHDGQNIARLVGQISGLNPRIPAQAEGRFAIVTNVGRDCGGRDVPTDEWHGRGRRSRVVPAPDAGAKSCGILSRGDGGKRARLTRESAI